MKTKLWPALAFLGIALLVNVSNLQKVGAAISQYGMPGIYNSTALSLTSGSGAALAVDSQGKLILSSTTALQLSITDDFYPDSNNARDLGIYGRAWNDLFVSGTARMTYVSSTAISATTVCLGSDCQTAWPSGSGIGDPFTHTTNYGLSVSATTTPIWFRTGLMSSSTSYIDYVSSTAMNLSSLTITATGILTIPQSSNPNVSVSGDIAINTTAASSSLRFYDGTAERALYPTKPTCIAFTSSTAQTIAGMDATSTVEIGTMFRPETWTSATCYAKNGTGGVDFGDGTNFTEYVPCTTLTTSTIRTLSSNNTFTMGEGFQVRARINTGAEQLSICVLRRIDAD